MDNRKRYFKWLVSKIDYGNCMDKYSQLLRDMYRTNYIWDHEDAILCKNENRSEDGMYLRYLFEEETGQNVRSILFDIGKPCSFLEMLIALAMRIEDDVMGEGENRYDFWFWKLVERLKLMKFDIENYDSERVLTILDDFMGDSFGDSFEKGAKKTVTGEKNELWIHVMNWLNDEFL